jgi:hypothetical protein
MVEYTQVVQTASSVKLTELLGRPVSGHLLHIREITGSNLGQKTSY